jgi:hypothetical protein
MISIINTLLNGWLLLKENFKETVWGIKINENWGMRYKKELMQLFGYLYILSFFSFSRLN